MNTKHTISLLATLGLAVTAVPAQLRVDHTPWQTAIRHQGFIRRTCITFAGIAALEARYKRLGMTVDLSEEFCNYVHKMLWLNLDWAPIAAGGADFRENQVGAFGGGTGVGILRQLASGAFAVPTETVMPYKPGGYPGLPPWNDPYWSSQRAADDFNLDPVNLPRAALKAPAYYSATGYASIAQPTSAAAIEAALVAGHDVVWDFAVLGDRSGPIWHATPGGTPDYHAMLIVGYDRTSSDPRQQYFICKNSWGPTANPGGYTYIGYDYLQYGVAAGYVTGAATPTAWPELQLLGRRNICFDGWRGTLDVYHLPGAAQIWFNLNQVFVTDRRVGTFYDSGGNAHRVNGVAVGKTLYFWFKQAPNANMRWDEQRETPTVGRMFHYTIVDDDGEELAGTHYDNPGPVANPPYGGYARCPSSILANDGFLTPVFESSLPVDPSQWLGRWRLQIAGFAPSLYVTHRDDGRLTAAERLLYAGLVSQLVEPGTGSRIEFVAKVELANANRMHVQVDVPAMGGTVSTTGLMLSWQRGVFAGQADVGAWLGEACYGVRYGSHLEGVITTFGGRCGPAGSRPIHGVSGYPELNEPLQLTVANVPPSTGVILAMGLSRTQSNGTPLPYSLDPLGAPGCYVRVDPMAILFALTDQQGFAAVPQTFQHPALLGARVYSQFFALHPGANALGLTSSNGVNTLLGGLQ